MGRLGQHFIRFPHRCEIYSMGEVTPFSDGEKVVHWRGRCRKEANTSKRVFKSGNTTTGQVVVTQYGIQLGALVGGRLSGDADAAPDGRVGEECGAIVEGIKSGMMIDVIDRQGKVEKLLVADAYCGNLGTTVYFENPKN